MAVYANTLASVAGRGTGKSTGVIAPRLSGCIVRMPFSNNGLLSKTYKQTQTRTLPAIKSGWSKLGFKEWDPKKGGHYTIGKRNSHFPLPDEAPDDWEHVIHWFTGAIISMSSQDRKNDSNGLNLQSIHGDEAKLLDFEDLTESIMPTLRGMPQYKDFVEYRMITWTSDMPTTPEAKWLFDFEQQCDQDTIELIIQNHLKLQHQNALLQTSNSESTRTRAKYQINSINKELSILRKGLIHYAEASSFDNIDMLTPEYIEIQRRNLPDFVFETSILNKRPLALEAGQRFYPQLSKKNFYSDHDYSYLDQFIELPGEKDNSLGDRDCNRNEPLDVVIDWGGKINSMLVGQEDVTHNRYNILKEFFALQPENIYDLIEALNRYYCNHNERIINLYYDRNGNTHVANSKETYAELVQRLLYASNWIVDMRSFEENPGHRDKFEFINLALTGRDRRLPAIKINESNCPNLLIALYNTPIKIVNGELKKDKGSERSTAIPQQQATHITDCFDIVLFSRYKRNIDESMSSVLGLMS